MMATSMKVELSIASSINPTFSGAVSAGAYSMYIYVHGRAETCWLVYLRRLITDVLTEWLHSLVRVCVRLVWCIREVAREGAGIAGWGKATYRPECCCALLKARAEGLRGGEGGGVRQRPRALVVMHGHVLQRHELGRFCIPRKKYRKNAFEGRIQTLVFRNQGEHVLGGQMIEPKQRYIELQRRRRCGLRKAVRNTSRRSEDVMTDSTAYRGDAVSPDERFRRK